jgi:hypothetical protein
MAKKIRSNEKRGKRGQKQKQKQVQNVQQKVVVRIGDVSKKKSRARRSRKPREQSEGVSTLQAFPPPVIYQSYAQPPVPTSNLPLEQAPTIKNVAPKKVFEDVAVGTDKKAFKDIAVGTAKRIFEDVGIGTEGFVEILEPPKPEYLDLVQAINVKPIKEDDFYSKKIKELRSMREPMNDWNLPAKPVIPPQYEPLLTSPQIEMGMPYSIPSKPAETDEPSIPPAFKPSFTSPKIDENLLTPERQETTPRVSSVKKMSEEIKRSRQVNLAGREIESLMTGPSIEQEQNIPDMPEIKQKKAKGKDTWKYWREQYRQMTGQEISLKEAKQQGSIYDFIDFVKRIK